MKKFAKITALMLVIIMSIALLASCGVSQKTAEKINNAANNGEAMSYDEVKKLCGGEQSIGKLALGVGVLTWVNGCKNSEDVQKKIENGDSFKALVVTFAGGKAISAVYADYDKNSNK